MKSSRRYPSRIQPEIKNKLISLCEDYISYPSEENTHTINTLHNVLVYLKYTLSNEEINITELISACLFHALFRAMYNLESLQLIKRISTELTAIKTHPNFDKLHYDDRTSHVISSFTTMLKQSQAIKCDIDALKTRIQFIDLQCRLKNSENNTEDLQQILSEITLSEMNKDKAPDAFQLLVNEMIVAAVKIGCVDSFEEYIRYSVDRLNTRLMIDAVTHLQKNMVEWMQDHHPYLCSTSILSQAMTILMNMEKTSREKMTPLTPTFFEITDMIFNDTRFNPNYPITYSLMKEAVTKNSLYFINRCLEHPYINLMEIKNNLVPIADMKTQGEQIDCLLKHPPFYALEQDWLGWSYNQMRLTNWKPFQKIVIDNHFFHHQPKWLLFRFATTDEVLPFDIKNEILKKYHMVCYPGLLPYFKNNTHHGFFTKKTDVNASQKDNTLFAEDDNATIFNIRDLMQ